MIWEAAPTGKRGRQPGDSDAAIQACLTLKVLFGMALRQTTGLVESLLNLTGRERVAFHQVHLTERNAQHDQRRACLGLRSI